MPRPVYGWTMYGITGLLLDYCANNSGCNITRRRPRAALASSGTDQRPLRALSASQGGGSASRPAIFYPIRLLADRRAAQPSTTSSASYGRSGPSVRGAALATRLCLAAFRRHSPRLPSSPAYPCLTHPPGIEPLYPRPELAATCK